MISQEIAKAPSDTVAQKRQASYRWVICLLLFLVATINYIARQAIGLLKPALQSEIGWNEIGYSNIIFGFQLAYAIGLLLFGKLMDRLGTRTGFSWSVALWSVAAMAHALASSVLGFGIARFALGLGQSGNFPASIKTVAEWFPKNERALATGIFNAGTNFGPVIAPILLASITLRYSWRIAFIFTGILGGAWLVLWLVLYRQPTAIEDHGVARETDRHQPAARIPWATLVRRRQTWAFATGKFLTDPIWWLFLFWLPDFLYKSHGMTLVQIAPPLLVIYGMATVGSVGGGWLSSYLMRRGWTVNASRKTAMLTCALAVVPIVIVSQVSNLWVAVILIGLAVAAHQGWSANMFTIATDMFPAAAVGSVVGIGGMFGAIGGLLFAKITGYVLQWTGSYITVFGIAGTAYLAALAVIQALVPKLEQAQI